MKDISIRHVDVYLIIFDICLIFRFPRLLKLISAAHLTFCLLCSLGDVGLDTFQARFVPVALLLLTTGSLKWENHLLFSPLNFEFETYQFFFKKRGRKKHANEK